MSLVPIPAITRAASNSPAPQFSNPVDVVEGELEEPYLNEFGQIHSVANLAYLVCCAEWLFFFLRDRFKKKAATHFEHYLEAFWVWLADVPRKLPPYYDLGVAEQERAGSADIVAVELALDSIWEGVMSIPDGETHINATMTTQLCDHVLPETCGFDQWRVAVVQRLAAAFPPDNKDHELIQVSRRLFDTDIDPGDVDHEADCSALVRKRQARGSRYLPLTVPDE